MRRNRPFCILILFWRATIARYPVGTASSCGNSMMIVENWRLARGESGKAGDRGMVTVPSEDEAGWFVTVTLLITFTLLQ